jgi:flagellar basal-body rod modification protein FlgD
MDVTASNPVAASGAAAVGASGATGTGAAAGTSKSQLGLADDFNSFLQLLTTQLQHQDPLAPMDANQFTQQLVQFSAVEQAIKTNDTLGQLLTAVRGEQIGRSVDYLGAEVEAPGETVRLGGTSTAQINYQLGQAASSVTISIYNQAGQLVASRQGAGDAGSHSVAWDGRDQSGAPLPAGLYRVDIAATDASGAPAAANTSVHGVVDGVEISGDQVLLSVDGVLLPLDSVTSIHRPQASA